MSCINLATNSTDEDPIDDSGGGDGDGCAAFFDNCQQCQSNLQEIFSEFDKILKIFLTELQALLSISKSTPSSTFCHKNHIKTTSSSIHNKNDFNNLLNLNLLFNKIDHELQKISKEKNDFKSTCSRENKRTQTDFEFIKIEIGNDPTKDGEPVLSPAIAASAKSVLWWPPLYSKDRIKHSIITSKDSNDAIEQVNCSRLIKSKNSNQLQKEVITGKASNFNNSKINNIDTGEKFVLFQLVDDDAKEDRKCSNNSLLAISFNNDDQIPSTTSSSPSSSYFAFSNDDPNDITTFNNSSSGDSGCHGNNNFTDVNMMTIDEVVIGADDDMQQEAIIRNREIKTLLCLLCNLCGLELGSERELKQHLIDHTKPILPPQPMPVETSHNIDHNNFNTAAAAASSDCVINYDNLSNQNQLVTIVDNCVVNVVNLADDVIVMKDCYNNFKSSINKVVESSVNSQFMHQSNNTAAIGLRKSSSGIYLKKQENLRASSKGSPPTTTNNPKNSTKNRYYCKICEQIYVVDQLEFELHKLTHLPKPAAEAELLFKCEKCNHSFAFKDSLLKHHADRHPDEPQVCTACDKRYRFQSLLILHRKHCHRYQQQQKQQQLAKKS